MARFKDMLQKMMRRFDPSDEHAKELRDDLDNIGKKVDGHAVSIKHLELKMNKEDSGAFTIPCTIDLSHFAKALCDLNARINLVPLSIYKKLGLGDTMTTAMQLFVVDQTVTRPIGILHDVLVKVESFIFPADFVILECEVDFE
ncbi:uncharacterized protein LOC107016708 [Solanum pennellii]|uniref:Uncharacterized protein LOC107016708 n=1 Tax=Solanum pennellii TaxID=28526 RepID=A0ABM1GKZ2_SOLPN|nr:uncharacterized protein LOC107016708 [Solanum pennellii]